MTDARHPGGALVEARGWGWRYGSRRRPAVAGLDLRIEPGERVLLLGASGAGKSTVLHGLAGVLGDAQDGEEEGRLLIDGRRPVDARGRVGLVLQDPDAQVMLARVGDDIAFGCENLGVARDEIWRRVDAAIEAVGLDLPRSHPTSALSGGQKQRLALAGVVAMRPGLILLDEPTANLDPDGVAEVRDAVARVAADTGATLVVIEHRVAVWADLVDRVVVLGPGTEGGGVIADGAPEAIFDSHAEALTDAGIWVPGVEPDPPSRRRTEVGPALLRAEGLAVGRTPFGSRNARVVAGGVELEVHAGRALAVTGPNGAGKSTLALTLAGLLPAVGGQVLASEGLADGAGPAPIRWRSRELLTRIGTVFQDPEHQLLASTVRGELEVGPRALGLSETEIAERTDALLDRLRLRRLAKANPYTLSGGEKRRLSVATVLATAPRIIVLDEPTFGQDARTWRELVALLAELLDEGTAVVAVTHDADFVRVLADAEFRLGHGLRPIVGAA